MMPAALFGCAYILAFHRGRPVCLRVFCTLLLPLWTGAILHLFFAGNAFPWDNSLVFLLWAGGKNGSCGGAVGGLFAMLLSAVFSKIGAGLILFLTLGVLLMVISRISWEDVLDWFRTMPPLVEYEVQPEPERPTRNVPRTEPLRLPTAPQTPASSPSPPLNAPRRRVIDIPVDEGPLAEPIRESAQESVKEPEQTLKPERDLTPDPEETFKPEKKSFFNRKSKVPAPDQILTGTFFSAPEPVQPSSEEPPPPFTEPTERVESSSPPPKRQGKAPPPPPQEPEPYEELPPKLEPQEEPEPLPVPEIVREPAVRRKRQREDAAKAVVPIERGAVEGFSPSSQGYQYPPLHLLDEMEPVDAAGLAGELRVNQERLEDAIRSFGIDANLVDVTRGPSVTRYELELDQGVRLNKLTNLSEDIALALGASGVRIAPIPGKISVVGIEVPNQRVTTVSLHEVIDSDCFQDHPSKVAFAVGKDISGNPIVGDIAKLPHLLVAGTTGSGKSVCTNSLIISLLYKASPEDVRLIMVDPKMVELGVYNGIPHLLIPVVTDPKKAAGALQWAVTEMMNRYRTFSEMGVRKLKEYNVKASRSGGELKKIPAIIVVIDELADLMLVAAKEVEESICRVAQMGRAAGIHLIIATQRPSSDVITGLMKANIPSRIAFAVASSLESRIILDQVGAEKLVGRGDMLYFPMGDSKPTRIQGCFISDDEVTCVTEFVKRSNGGVQYDETVIHDIERNVSSNEKGGKSSGSAALENNESYDELLPAAISVVVDTGMASVSMLQRRLKLGYSRAARLVDQMEEKGIVGPFEGSKPRQVLITKSQWQEMQYRQGMVEKAPDATDLSEASPETSNKEGNARSESQKLPPFKMDEEHFST